MKNDVVYLIYNIQVFDVPNKTKVAPAIADIIRISFQHWSKHGESISSQYYALPRGSSSINVAPKRGQPNVVSFVSMFLSVTLLN